MDQALDLLLMLAVALNFYALGASRIRAVINAVALQGILLGLCPLVVDLEIGYRGLLLVCVTVVLKGFVIPRLLERAMREANIQHEVAPYVGYMASLLLGAIGTGSVLVFSFTLPM